MYRVPCWSGTFVEHYNDRGRLPNETVEKGGNRRGLKVGNIVGVVVLVVVRPH